MNREKTSKRKKQEKSKKKKAINGVNGKTKENVQRETSRKEVHVSATTKQLSDDLFRGKMTLPTARRYTKRTSQDRQQLLLLLILLGTKH